MMDFETVVVFFFLITWSCMQHRINNRFIKMHEIQEKQILILHEIITTPKGRSHEEEASTTSD